MKYFFNICHFQDVPLRASTTLSFSLYTFRMLLMLPETEQVNNEKTI